MIGRPGEGRLFGERAAELAGHAATLLGWRPAEFWSATPAELATALGLESDGGEAMDRARLERLASLYPDSEKYDGR